MYLICPQTHMTVIFYRKYRIIMTMYKQEYTTLQATENRHFCAWDFENVEGNSNLFIDTINW